ncbi:MAG: hypothetical protein NTW06_01760, partial [Candidatus Falkowbacteria bacterium]|nr:hypothetical protein [Candidatus Falkowbacteria bacterium]
MAKRTRNILFAIFILIFIIVTPLVCLYATGYQIGQNFSIQKTGILVVKTAPREANVYLENKTQKKLVADLLATDKNKSYLTPAKIKGLLSGEYDITINKDNYWPWNKKLVINPGQSLYLENITLFKNSSPALLTEKNYSSILPSPDRMYLLAIYPTGVDIVDLNSNKINNLDLSKNIAQPIAIEKCSWSPDSKKFAVAGMVYDLADLKPTNLNEIIKKPLSQLQWDDSQA